jgi:hypothetical protein
MSEGVVEVKIVDCGRMWFMLLPADTDLGQLDATRLAAYSTGLPDREISLVPVEDGGLCVVDRAIDTPISGRGETMMQAASLVFYRLRNDEIIPRNARFQVIKGNIRRGLAEGDQL